MDLRYTSRSLSIHGGSQCQAGSPVLLPCLLQVPESSGTSLEMKQVKQVKLGLLTGAVALGL